MVYPDLRFRERSTGRRFWVEVKYRARAEENGKITWCNENQLRHYKRTMYETGEPVFIMIGVGGSGGDADDKVLEHELIGAGAIIALALVGMIVLLRRKK